jgi:hypothetical protein
VDEYQEVNSFEAQPSFFKRVTSADDFYNRWRWFTENNFLTVYPILLLDDSFTLRGIIHARQMKRAFFIIDLSDDEILRLINAKALTFLGERRHFTFDMLQKICSLDTPASIITANDLPSLDRYLTKSANNSELSIHEPLIMSFLTEPDGGLDYKEFLGKLKSSSALFFCAHGDILCINLNHAILCSHNPHRTFQASGKLPACVSSHQCFRINRLRGLHPQTPIVHLNELSAQVLFFNTCAGFSITKTKYDDYPGLLPLVSLENGVLIYISSYLIKRFCIEEVFLLWALIKKHKNFSIAVHVFNRIGFSALGTERSMVILGDGSINIFERYDIEYQPTIVVSQKDILILQIEDIKTSAVVLSLVTGEHDMLSDNCIEDLITYIDVLEGSTACIYGDDKKFKANILIQFHETFPDKARVYVLTRRSLLSQVNLQKNRARSTVFPKLLMLDLESQEDLQLKTAELNQLFIDLDQVMSFSDLNGAKYLYINAILKRLGNSSSGFEDLLINAIIKRSLEYDTPLILDETSLEIRTELCITKDKCYICGNNLFEICYKSSHRSLIDNSLQITRSICPKCEIISVSTGQRIIRIFAPDFGRRDNQVSIRIAVSVCSDLNCKGTLGIALLKGKISLIREVHLSTQSAYTFTFSVPEELPTGLYYWRSILIYNGEMTIAHKQMFVV